MGLQDRGEMMYAYNPRKKSAEELEKSLVGRDRWEILNRILAELNLKEGENPKQHWIVVGPRGMGKSHLLTLLYHRVKTDSSLNGLWLPVLFPEELRMASDLAGFLERTVREVLYELEAAKDPYAGELKVRLEAIKNRSRGERADYIFTVLTEIHRKTGRFILLVVENLQKLLGKKLDLTGQKKLRAYLQTEESLLLVGSATSVFDKLHDHSNPFYHFFHIRRLQDLNFEDTKSLILKILSTNGNGDFARKITAGEARLKAIYSFTGGNPRMAVFLSDILRAEIHEEMLSIMDGILDELTPYFEAIMNDTPECLHDIMNCLAAYEPAQSPKDIAEHLEVPQTTVRSYIKQLKEMQYVRVAFSRGKSNYYCLNEYLYRIWYQMRDSGHREETRWLLELLVMLYEPSSISKEKEIILGYGMDLPPALRYETLILQAEDFIRKNPGFCSIVEHCAETTIPEDEVAEKQKRPRNHSTRLNALMRGQGIRKNHPNLREDSPQRSGISSSTSNDGALSDGIEPLR